MPEYRLERKQILHAPLEQVFDFFADAGNLERLTPPWLHFRIRTPLPIAMGRGTLIDYTIRWRGIPLSWRTRIEEWNPPLGFVDTQIRGPYRLWHHTHRFRVVPEGVEMTDVVRYTPPLGALGVLAYHVIVRRDVEGIFDYRCGVIQRQLLEARGGEIETRCRK